MGSFEIDTLGGEVVRIMGAFFGSNGAFNGYAHGKARYSTRYLGRDCIVDDHHDADATTVVTAVQNGTSLSTTVKQDALLCRFCPFLSRGLGSTRRFTKHMLSFPPTSCPLLILFTRHSTVPGVGTGHAWQIQIANDDWGATTDALVMSYAPPVITYMDPDQWPFGFTQGGNRIIISGRCIHLSAL